MVEDENTCIINIGYSSDEYVEERVPMGKIDTAFLIEDVYSIPAHSHLLKIRQEKNSFIEFDFDLE
jgi:hypothetical protein